ncbi:MAG: ubiquinone/menaquinone biosynthesis methyltransferase [Parcubacteria group bacterium Gr01-1014_13]|nr:MAG: ubiquinone/menaquinone biosynthesis methyltransferase [Parcubacteria group bacterium Gr01-1014_13]
MPKKIKVLSSEDGYNLAADLYDENEKYLNSFEQGELIPLLAGIAGKKVLDVGAGTGRLSVALANRDAQVTALDVSPKMLEKIKRKNAKIQTVVGDAESLPFKNETFEIVSAAFLIVHLKDPTRFFDEVYRVLKDGGIFVVTNINQKDPPLVKTKEGQIIIESFYHRPEKIKEILESLAFNIEEEVFVKEKDLWVDQIVLARK